MLLEAAIINPHLELVGQDIDPRCARMTALNLGLRGRYGWVVCGNSLTGNTSFAYRIGSFYHETPHGLRRGVIRDVPPEATPVSVITSQLQSATAELFAEASVEPAKMHESLPAIIEVPRWLARLEPQWGTLRTESEAIERDTPPTTSQAEPTTGPETGDAEPSPDDPPTMSQRRLF
jgi:hypothetical protein